MTDSIQYYPIHNSWENILKEKSENVLLPNLRYKDGNIFFKSKNPIKIMLNGKKEFKSDFLLSNLAFNDTVYWKDIELNCTIMKEELEDGLKINIKYMDRHTIYRNDIQKFARVIEATILNINIIESDDCEIDSYSDEYEYSSENDIDEYEYEQTQQYDQSEQYDEDNYYEEIDEKLLNFD